MTKRAAQKAKPIKRKKTAPKKKAAAKPAPPVAKDLPPNTPLKAKPNNNGKHAGGRPTGYIPAYCEKAYEYCLLKNATDSELAKYLGVNTDTINEWKIRYPQFSVSIDAGKEGADAKVAAGLYNRAVGMTLPDVHVSNYQGNITITKLVKHIPPEVKAAELWLRNRQGKHWKKGSGLDGGELGAVLGIHIHESLKTSK